MILRAEWAVPIASPPIREGCVEIDGARIGAVGHVAEFGSTQVEDLGSVVLIPGLVNPHTHLELGCYANALDPAPFWTWIEGLVCLRTQPGQPDREQQAVVDGASQSLRAGVTCVGDISRQNLAWSALKPLPMRKVCFVELLTLANQPPRDPIELRKAVAAVVEDELLTVGVSPHAPYTVPADQIRSAIALADELDRPWTMHLAETREEVAFLRGERGVLAPMIETLLERRGVRSPRQSPIELLAACGRDLRSGTLAHANYLADEQFGRLAEMGHVVVYCPRAHQFFGHSPHPFSRLREAGVAVALGTDSLASNRSLSILDELHHVRTQVPDSPSPHDLLRMATLMGARALGLENQIGSLETGKQADLAAFPCQAGATDPVRQLIEHPVQPSAVWVAGRRVV